MSMVYDSLIPPLRSLVDRLTAETASEPWETRRAYLASIYTALDRAHQADRRIEPEDALSAIVAALIEKSGAPEIRSRLQAGIYQASALPEHRDAASAWFDTHPEEYAAIRQEMTAGGMRLN